MKELKEVLTSSEIAKYCNVTRQAVSKWVKDGKLKAYKTPGGRYRIMKRDFIDFLKQHNLPLVRQLIGNKYIDIVIVDDESQIRETIVEAVKQISNSFMIFEATDGVEGLLKIGEVIPDLVIADLRMPYVDGVEMCRKIRENPLFAKTKILIISGYLEDYDIDQLDNIGVDGVISKPFRITDLQDRVARVLDLK
jgi:excisionase family DNA binding protein